MQPSYIQNFQWGKENLKPWVVQHYIRADQASLVGAGVDQLCVVVSTIDSQNGGRTSCIPRYGPILSPFCRCAADLHKNRVFRRDFCYPLLGVPPKRDMNSRCEGIHPKPGLCWAILRAVSYLYSIFNQKLRPSRRSFWLSSYIGGAPCGA